jgi:flagellar capping protein FliD
MDWQTTVQELATAERAPETQWKTEQTTINSQNSAFTTIAGALATLQTDLKTLQDPTLYQSASAQSGFSNRSSPQNPRAKVPAWGFPWYMELSNRTGV